MSSAMLAILGGSGLMTLLLALRIRRAERDLRHLAMHDPLTDVLNRGAFMQLAERELARAARERSAVAVLMLDLDYFKHVNDVHGHRAGDRVLVEFARRAAGCLRVTDLLGRYGGEEFCAVLPATRHGEAMAIAERVRHAVQASPLGGLTQPVTVSMGVATFDGASGAALDYVIERADSALYAAKGLGRNRVVGIEPAKSRHPTLAAGLRAA